MSAAQPTVLFLCTDNSVRSQLGEALLRHRAGDRVEACSAGLMPKPVHPMVSEVLREIGIEPPALEPKAIGPFLGRRGVRYAVILRDADEADAPRIFPFATRTVRWDVGDPARAGDEVLPQFRRVRDEIDAHVRALVNTLDADERGRAA
jgi:protein-tyrosine-phosphatase